MKPIYLATYSTNHVPCPWTKWGVHGYKVNIGKHYENLPSLTLQMRALSITWQCMVSMRRPCMSLRIFCMGNKVSISIHHFISYTYNSCRYSILPMLSLDEILHVEVFDHTINGANLLSFIEGLVKCMQPWLLPNSVLIWTMLQYTGLIASGRWLRHVDHASSIFQHTHLT